MENLLTEQIAAYRGLSHSEVACYLRWEPGKMYYISFAIISGGALVQRARLLHSVARDVAMTW